MSKKKFTYEDKSKEIDHEIVKRRGKWKLNSLAWIDFNDVEQIIRAHIFRKWHQWDQERSLLPWINKIISNQLKNILRNYYHNFAKPCVNCPFSSPEIDGDLCSFTPSGYQDTKCPLFAKWYASKRHAHDIKMAVSIEKIPVEMSGESKNSDNIDNAITKMNNLLKENLSEKHYNIYEMLFIKNIPEEEVAAILGYKTSEKGRKAGYKQIKNLKKMLKQKAERIIDRNDFFY